MRRHICTFMAFTCFIILTLSGCGAAKIGTTSVESTETIDTIETAEVSNTNFAIDNTHSYKTGQTLDKSETTTVENDITVEDTTITTTELSPYTFTELSTTMFATSSVNVRDLPSTDGNKIGQLTTNQEMIVTGQCNETGWYRIVYNDTVAYVSNNYMSPEQKATSTNTATKTANFNRNKAVEVFNLINAERSANGASQLTWDENLYNYACVRVQQITANFAHDNSPYGENIGYMPYIQTANDIHMQYYNSPGHHQNYLNGMYVYGAVAVYEVDGVSYHVELFNATSDNTYGNIAPQHSEIEQEWGATTVASWTASNGIVFDILSDGNVAMHYGGYSDEEIEAAIAEFMNYMGYSY